MKDIRPYQFCLVVATIILFLCACNQDKNWYRGNLHTHSLWSDGDDYPEMVVKWYKDNGYHFLAISDHNTLAEGERWLDVANTPGDTAAYENYLTEMGAQWVESRRDSGRLAVRLKTLSEYRPLFEDPAEFLLIQAEEITARFGKLPLHVNATNLQRFIPPHGGNSVVEVLQNNIDAILQQRRQTNAPMFPHVNHPNFRWAISIADMLQLRGENFFEIYNGHPLVQNQGDSTHLSTEQMWDIILAERLSTGRPPMYGLAVDDAHHYHENVQRLANPGRGWIVVRAAQLAVADLIEALETGDFYASTGVELQYIVFEDTCLAVTIKAAPGVSYRTQFIGTKKSMLPVTIVEYDSVKNKATQHYREDLGMVFAEVSGSTPTYQFAGDELYIRAKIISSRMKKNPGREGEFEVAWTQPFGSRQSDGARKAMLIDNRL